MSMATDSHIQVPRRNSTKVTIKSLNRRRSSVSPKAKNTDEQFALLDSSSSGSLEKNLDNPENEATTHSSHLGDYDTHLFAYFDDHDFANTTAIISSSDDDADDDQTSTLGDDVDDLSIEAEEEDAIREEINRKSRSTSIPGPISLQKLSQSQHSQSHQDHFSDDSDSSDAISETSSWDNDVLENFFDSVRYPQSQTIHHHNSRDPRRVDAKFADDFQVHADNSKDSGDDTYPWQYFFSSDEDDELESTSFVTRPKQKRFNWSHPEKNNGVELDSGSTDEDLPLKGRGPLPARYFNKTDSVGYIPSGDSTDEDDGVPPERKRKRARGSKAIEVLGSNSFSARPPILGSWKIKGDKNVGIIDGLTMRTLSPPMPQISSNQKQPPREHLSKMPRDSVEITKESLERLGEHDLSTMGDFTDFGEVGSHKKDGQLVDEAWNKEARNDDAEFSDLDLLELGDFINTENMSSDENDGNVYEFDLLLNGEGSSTNNTSNHGNSAQQSQRQLRTPMVSPYLYRNRISNKSVPISAFRTRGSPYVQNPAYPSENYSPVPRRRRSSVNGRQSMLLKEPNYLSSAPLGTNKKRIKKSKAPMGSRTTFPTHPPQNLDHNNNNNQGAGNEHDFIGELIEIGALSPLFDVDQ